MTAEHKARNVAESILAHQLDTSDAATWQRYGLADNPDQRALVELYLQRHRTQGRH
jgi:hypothetical protein